MDQDLIKNGETQNLIKSQQNSLSINEQLDNESKQKEDEVPLEENEYFDNKDFDQMQQKWSFWTKILIIKSILFISVIVCGIVEITTEKNDFDVQLLTFLLIVKNGLQLIKEIFFKSYNKNLWNNKLKVIQEENEFIKKGYAVKFNELDIPLFLQGWANNIPISTFIYPNPDYNGLIYDACLKHFTFIKGQPIILLFGHYLLILADLGVFYLIPWVDFSVFKFKDYTMSFQWLIILISSGIVFSFIFLFAFLAFTFTFLKQLILLLSLILFVSLPIFIYPIFKLYQCCAEKNQNGLTSLENDIFKDISYKQCLFCSKNILENQLLQQLPCTEQHQIHEECAQLYLKLYHQCPICEFPINSKNINEIITFRATQQFIQSNQIDTVDTNNLIKFKTFLFKKMYQGWKIASDTLPFKILFRDLFWWFFITAFYYL